ncbi:MAG: translation initiation factor IF-2 [Candidatus Competibacteraceae bacterium]|nr:translation initiation factor IF-2 [Candidatus Competibacteraceae bacterium]MBK7984081.1 translation initiation factor IF-2 [Candidatus Competibacteraceae bacterium]MBK8896058.1 translation initiation factor IF-2 [Candidatus Competibacteraceae bacterium]
MTQVTVKQFATDVGIPVDRLLEQFTEAGIAVVGVDATITEKQKVDLLAHLRKSHGSRLVQGAAEPRKITLKRKTHSEIKMSGGMAGQVKTVSIEVRKKRTYVKRSLMEEGAPRLRELEEPAVAPVASSDEAGEERRHDEIALDQSPLEAPALHEQQEATHRIEEEARRLQAEEEARRLQLEAEEHARQLEEERARRRPEAVVEPQAERRDRPSVEPLVDAQPVESPTYRAPDAGSASPQTLQRPVEAGASAAAARTKKQSGPILETKVGKKRAEPPRAAGKPRGDIPGIANASAPRREEGQDDERFAPQRRGDVQQILDKADRRKPKKGKGGKTPASALAPRHSFAKPTAPMVREVIIPETISVADLAQKMSVKATEVIKAFLKMGLMVTINQMIDQDTAALAVSEMGHSYKLLKENALEEELAAETNRGEALPRPPVVTIMGHVDHGKTSLLDYIRRTRVAAGEAGGITQHIGAYHVRTPKGVITFLDTPGHAAFTAMRARGAKATDVVVLVVAADDGVMPQTVEAIQHARAAAVPVVVAVNKMDKSSADPERVKSELSAQGVISEEWGGDTLFTYVSAKSGAGVDDLLDQILVQAEVLELKAPVEGAAKGVVIESRLDKGRGPVATVLVHGGTLRKGDMVLSGLEYGRVRAMLDETGQNVGEAGPSIPVEVLGLSGAPRAGDELVVVADERKAREIALFRQNKAREEQARKPAISLDDISKQFEAGQVNVLNVVLKADVQGSTEAIVDALARLSTEEVQVKIIASGVGGINESDVNLARNAKAIIIGFNVRADSLAKKLAEEEGLKLHYYSVIYELIDDVKRAMVGMLKPEFKEEIIGLAEVRQVFRSPKFGVVAGCMVVEGTVRRNNPIRVLRHNVVIFEGALDSLRRFKDDVGEVRAGMECGMGVRNYNDIHEGDHIEVFERVQVERTL